MGAKAAPPELGPVPSYRFPEAAITALSRVSAYGAWRRRPKGSVPHLPGVQTELLREVINGALSRGDGWLTPTEAQTLIEGVGLCAARTHLITTDEEAVSIARQIGYPVALKAVGPEILHKTDVGGVILDIRNDSALSEAFRTLKSRVGDAMSAAVVQQMIPGGVELLIGAVVDPTFGPLIVCGAGGVLVELLHDTAFRIHPLTDLDAVEMLDSLKSVELLRGYRGHTPADEGAAADALLRVSALLEICPEIQELEINPLKVLEHGATAVDIRARVVRAQVGTPTRRIAY